MNSTMNNSLTCVYCGNENVEFKKNQTIVFHSPNPGAVKVKTDCYECSACGEQYFDEGAAEKVSVAIDKKISKKN